MNLPIPLTVITGFLGSGKTTLLKALLARPEMAGTAVIVNEFGEVGIDDALLAEADDEMVLLPSGCVCCAVRGDLVKALIDLHQRVLDGRIPEFSRVALETTGLADPAPIIETLQHDRNLFAVYCLDGIVTTVDAVYGLQQIEAHFEPAKQIAVADCVVVTKSDLVPAAALAALETRIGALNPAAGILLAVKGEIAPDALFGLEAHEVRPTSQHVPAWLAAEQYTDARTGKRPGGDDHGHEHDHGHDCGDPDCTHEHHAHDHAHSHSHDHDHAHDNGGHLHGIASFALTFERPLHPAKLETAMERLRRAHGEKMLRVKGILDIAGQSQPFVVHGVQHTYYPPEVLLRWPSADRRSRLVFIVKDLDRTTILDALGDVMMPAAA